MSYDLSTSHEEILGLVEDLKDVPVKRDQGGQDEVIRSLSQEDTELRLDLRPFMQLDPCVISSDANVAKAYRLFQKMGLSHLYVSPSGAQPIVGVITRKDLTLENCQLQLGERASYEMKVMRSRGENGGGNSGDGPQGEV
jgi:signal-transduction protein with cAMP-binding, CBS, and nucleotidyltransferase domain